MASVVHSFAVSGVDGHLVKVEADTMVGLSSVSIVGLGDKAVKEARERLEAAMAQAGFIFPLTRIVFNLAPSDMKKTGTHFDLPMAIALLFRTNQIPSKINLKEWAIIGELSLNADVRSVSGLLPMIIKAREVGLKKIIVPLENVAEANLVSGVDIYGCATLKQATDILIGNTHQIHQHPKVTPPSPQENLLDFKDVIGQEKLLDYIVIAAAGGHNLLMIGPPGCGKSMIAKRIPSILPEMTENESLEVTKIYSVANQLKNKGHLMTTRPFRAPHHNASTNALIGGGTHSRPGEISLAHQRVLFLDEMTDFSRKTLDALRQPLEDQTVTISRVWGSNTYPANFMLFGAMNPCQCGYFGQERCRCTDYEVAKYRQRLSGPILDRLDIQKYVKQIDFFGGNGKGRSSEVMKKQVSEARKRQADRYRHLEGRIHTNAQLTPSQIKEFCPLDSETTNLLQKAYERFQYSGRSLHKFIKIARTIADLEGEQQISVHHMRTSLQSRDLEKENHILQGG